MIKIDFHIHTIPIHDKNEKFIFSLQKLKEYVSIRKINAIAITNHNLFDYANYISIKNSLDITVYPGIEVDLENGHMLVITDSSNLVSFKTATSIVQSETVGGNSLSVNRFLTLFSDKSKYLFIPHYYKRPSISLSVIEKFGKDIFAGEVDNQNKFVRLYKEENDLTPVLFSDCRLEDDSELPMRATFLDTNLTDLSSIKETLRDKEKVFINKNKAKEMFAILDDGTEASTGLNIIVGKRSSGKTYTLDKIFNAFNNPALGKSVKYIRQFELIERDSDDREESRFSKILADKSSLYGQEYLQEFKTIVDYVQTISIDKDESNADSYITSLLEFAANSEKHDSFAKVPLFSDQLFSSVSLSEVEGLISATRKLLESENYKTLIEKHIPKDKLVLLLSELISEYCKRALLARCYEKANEIIGIVKQSLAIKSNQNAVSNLDIIKLAKDKYEVNKFINLVEEIKIEKEIKKTIIGKFTVSAKRISISSASNLQKVFKTNGTVSDCYRYYNNPYVYLLELKKSRIILDDQLYRGFVDIKYSVLNESGLPVSGGERAEYNLEEKISDADEYEMLLIDEPESSFDNIFLETSINTKIKELSKKIPVFVSTHNNVVGASIKADYVIFTEKEIINSVAVFRVYTGEISGKLLKTVDGLEKKNFEVQLDCLEGGDDAYQDRGITYENIKN